MDAFTFKTKGRASLKNMFCCLHSDFSFFLSPSLSLHDFVDFFTYRTYVLGVEYPLGIIYIIIDTNSNKVFMLGIPMLFSLDFCGILR